MLVLRNLNASILFSYNDPIESIFRPVLVLSVPLKVSFENSTRNFKGVEIHSSTPSPLLLPVSCFGRVTAAVYIDLDILCSCYLAGGFAKMAERELTKRNTVDLDRTS